MSVRDLLAAALMISGALFVLLAGVGLLRMPDLYLRMSAASKAATLGVSLILFGVAVDFDDVGVVSRALAAVLFVFLTVPVASHRIGRAAYLLGVELYPGTRTDELRGKYRDHTRELSSEE